MSGTRPSVVLVHLVTIAVAGFGTFLLLHKYAPKIRANKASVSVPALTVPTPSATVPATTKPTPAAPPPAAASLLRTTKYRAALKVLERTVPSNGGVVYLDVRAAYVSVEYIDPDHGTLVQVGPTAGGTIAIQRSTILGIRGTFTVFPVSVMRAAAPARIVAGLRRSGVKSTAIVRMRLRASGGSQRWTIYLSDGRRFTADRDGAGLHTA
jgi:hypothetical protein